MEKKKKTRVVNVDLCWVLVIIALSGSSEQELSNSIAYELYGLLVLHWSAGVACNEKREDNI